MKRKWEVIIGIVGLVLCLFFLGGFSVTITSMDEGTYEKTVFPVLQKGISKDHISESFEAIKALASWFGLTMLVVLIFVLLATTIIWKNKYPRLAALFYTLAGFATLFGTQMIAFPLAFLFFLSGILCAFRKINNRGSQRKCIEQK
ncbi:DUF4064 domain-containing protein [Caldifermentibacillus hisashii]|uniref:DUF4064 domain-containing protein n=1 Tax=Caldifermentibacillus hisashii TaxID=996558 RepID=UPI0031FBBAC7